MMIVSICGGVIRTVSVVVVLIVVGATVAGPSTILSGTPRD